MNVATGRDELEQVVAGTEGNVDTNAGNLNVPDEAAGELAGTIARPELTLALSGRTLDIKAVFSRTAEMMAGSKFSETWATATTILLDIDVVDIDDRVNEYKVKNRPADKLLKVKLGWDILKTN